MFTSTDQYFFLKLIPTEICKLKYFEGFFSSFEEMILPNHRNSAQRLPASDSNVLFLHV